MLVSTGPVLFVPQHIVGDTKVIAKTLTVSLTSDAFKRERSLPGLEFLQGDAVLSFYSGVNGQEVRSHIFKR